MIWSRHGAGHFDKADRDDNQGCCGKTAVHKDRVSNVTFNFERTHSFFRLELNAAIFEE